MAKLISITSDAEKLVAYCARVSSPQNQNNENVEKLLSYCVKNGHWSIFEMANVVIEIETSRAISAQILRHRSFSFQEFSQRYAQAVEFESYPARSQDLKNRQNSVDNLSADTQIWFLEQQDEISKLAFGKYKEALDKGIAKECARFLLPLNTSTRLYMNGSIRSWIHYLNVRTDSSTQLEHREIAVEIKSIFCAQLPTIASALGWAAETNSNAGDTNADDPTRESKI